LPDVRVAGVVTAPPVFSISYRPTGVINVLHSDIVGYAKTHGLPVALLQQRMNEPALLDAIRAWKPDVFLVVGWYHVIPKSWRELAPAYGLHASLLPDYSGGAPLVWAMINGETKTGITLFQMDDGVDSGPIAEQAEESIHPDDTIATLYARIEDRGLYLLRQALPALASGALVLTPQDETKRCIVPQRAPEDGWINWAQEVIAIDRFVRAQTRPYPGAFSTLAGERFTLWAGQVDTESQQESPGLVQKVGSGYAVVCGHGRIILKEVTYGGRDYSQSQLHELLGGGGQRLGA
jgi:methionyl-tRNA formyltransferase